MNTVVIRFKDGYEFSFNCESARISTNQMSGKPCGYSFKGFDNKKILYVDLDDVEIIYSILKEEPE